MLDSKNSFIESVYDRENLLQKQRQKDKLQLINNVIKLYAEDNDLISIDVPHISFCYNQFNIF